MTNTSPIRQPDGKTVVVASRIPRDLERSFATVAADREMTKARLLRELIERVVLDASEELR